MPTPAKKKDPLDELVKQLKLWQKDPFLFIEDMWGLVPQPLLPEYEYLKEAPVYSYDKNGNREKTFSKDMFVPFEKGKHITFQQWQLFRSIKWALEGKAPLRIAVESGHGTGKSAALAILIIWFVICFENAQVPCTAPTAHQLHDILWKEIRLWMQRMPDEWSDLLDHTNSYLRVKESPDTWFARARTARKDKPEALAGVHGEHVLFVIDEASGVPNEVFNTAEGALTGPNVLVVMISNHTRLVGYYHEAFNSDEEAWQNLSFDSRQSPIVEEDYCERIAEKYGIDSDEYLIRVVGTAPKDDNVDDSGYKPLFEQGEIKIIKPGEHNSFTGALRLGVDPSGAGNDKTKWVVRDHFQARVVASENISTGKEIAKKTIDIQSNYNIPAAETDVDEFGVGSDTMHHLGLAGKRVNGWNVGERSDHDQFLNLRAQMYWMVRKWIKEGAVIIAEDSDEWDKHALGLRYRRTRSGKIQMMPKDQMKKHGYDSPDEWDALAITFLRAELDYDEEFDMEPIEDTSMQYPEIGV